MLMLIGEGKYDDIFFFNMLSDIQSKNKKTFRIKHQSQDLSKLLSCISLSIQQNMYYRCYIWGDHGKKSLINFTFRIIKQVLGYLEGESYFYIIRDTDDGNMEKIFNNWSDQIEAFVSTDKNYNKAVAYEKIDKNHFLFERNRHKLHIIVKLIPTSLEFQICKIYSKDNENICLEDGENYHNLLSKIADKNGKEKLDLVAESYKYLQNESWCRELKTEISNKLDVCLNL